MARGHSQELEEKVAPDLGAERKPVGPGQIHPQDHQGAPR
jgi:hypothetical protein